MNQPVLEALPRVGERIRERRDEIVALLGRLVAARTENPPGDERAAVEVLEGYFAERGVASRRLAEDPRRPNLVAGIGPGGGRALLLAAHLDTVPAGEGWTADPFRLDERDGRLHGLGTSDDKGSAAALAVAFATLAELGAVTAGRVLVALNADEENGSHHGMDFLRDALGEPVDAAIVAEASGVHDDFEVLWTAARSTYRFEIGVTGARAHTSLAESLGVTNAAGALVELLPRFRAHLGLAGADGGEGLRASLVPVRLRAGGPWGVVPDAAGARFDLRVDPGPSREEVAGLVAGALERAADELGIDAAISTPGSSMEWVESSAIDEDEPVVHAVRAAWRDTLGFDPPTGCFPGGTDARALTERGIPTVPGVGPGALVRAHTADEWVTADALEAAARIYATAALVYCL